MAASGFTGFAGHAYGQVQIRKLMDEYRRLSPRARLSYPPYRMAILQERQRTGDERQQGHVMSAKANTVHRYQ